MTHLEDIQVRLLSFLVVTHMEGTVTDPHHIVLLVHGHNTDKRMAAIRTVSDPLSSLLAYIQQINHHRSARCLTSVSSSPVFLLNSKIAKAPV